MYTEDISKQDISSYGFEVGMRVKAHPATDTFMRGDVYGTVKRIGRKHVHVLMDRSGRTLKFHPANLLDAVNY